jgi:hypothetical protein
LLLKGAVRHLTTVEFNMSSFLQSSLSHGDVLELVNRARAAFGILPLRKLPRGVRETSRQCVLGRSLGVEILLDDRDGPYALVLRYRAACALARTWGVGRPCASWNGWAVRLPSELSKFVQEFDACRYPELDSGLSAKTTTSVAELRVLRFDWISEQERVQKLLDQARNVCDSARDLCQKIAEQT